MKKIIHQFFVFLGVGLLNTGMTLGSILGLMIFFHVHPWIANLLGYGLGLLVSFTLNRKITFKNQGGSSASALRFLGAAAVAYGFNALTILWAEKGWGINLYLAQLFGNVAYTGSFFLLCRWIVFPNHHLASGSVEKFPAEFRQPVITGEWPSREDAYAVIKALLITSLLLWSLNTEGFNPLDDHTFARTILRGIPFQPYVNQELGRFYPLVAQEFVLISSLFDHEASLFYRMGVLKLVLLGWLLSLAISNAGQKGGAALILWLSGILSFGVAGTLFRLHAGDLNAMILLLGYLILLNPSQGGIRMHDARLWLGVFLAIWASLYKESIIVLLLMFSGLEFIRLRLQSQKKEALRHIPVLVYSVLYLVIYKLWAGHPSDTNYVLTHQIERLTVLEHFFKTNPAIFLLTLPIFLIRVLRNGLHWNRYLSFDAMLAVALGYTFLFILLGIFNQYYLLPGTAFSWVGIAGLLALHEKKHLFPKVVSTILLVILFENSPAIYSELAFQQKVVVNHGRFLDFIARWAPLHCGDRAPRCHVILESTSQESAPEIFFSLETFFALLAPERFTIAEDPSINGVVSVRSSWQWLADMGHKGDLILVNPYRSGPRLMDTPSLTTVFDSGDDWSPPDWRLDQWIQYCGMADQFACREKIALFARETGYRLLEKLRDTPSIRVGTALHNPDYSFDVESPLGVMHPEVPAEISVRIQNKSAETWFPDAGSFNPTAVRLSYRWFDLSGQVAKEGDRTLLPEPLLPGESIATTMKVEPPHQRGLYRLELGPVQEHIIWFPAKFRREVLVN